MEIKVHDYRMVMLNMAVPEKLFDNMEYDSVLSGTTIVVNENKHINAKWDRHIKVDSPFKNAEILLNEVPPQVIGFFRVCSRINTVRSSRTAGFVKPLAIPNANFVAHFSIISDVHYCFNNIHVFMNAKAKVTMENGELEKLPLEDKIHIERRLNTMLENDFLFVANRINSLFDGEVASLPQRNDIKLLQSKDMTLSIVQRKQSPEGEAVTLRWSVPTDLKDCWIRFDTSGGRASIEDEKAQTVTVSHIPPNTSVTATLYTISPDGKEWHYITLRIPAR
jgi:hypothetical protein